MTSLTSLFNDLKEMCVAFGVSLKSLLPIFDSKNLLFAFAVIVFCVNVMLVYDNFV